MKWYVPMYLHSHCRGRLAGDPLARSALGFPRGKPRTHKPLVITIHRASQLRRLAGGFEPPLPGAVETGGWRCKFGKNEHNPRKMSNGMVDDSDFFRYNGHTITQIVAYSLRI